MLRLILLVRLADQVPHPPRGRHAHSSSGASTHADEFILPTPFSRPKSHALWPSSEWPHPPPRHRPTRAALFFSSNLAHARSICTVASYPPRCRCPVLIVYYPFDQLAMAVQSVSCGLHHVAVGYVHGLDAHLWRSLPMYYPFRGAYYQVVSPPC